MRTQAGYWIGGVLVAVGVLGAIAWAVLSGARLLDKVDGFQHVAIPGRERVRFEPRKYTLYVEGPGADVRAPAIDVVVTDARRERRVAVKRYGGSLTYSFDRPGSAVATLRAPRAGVYVVRTDGPDGYRVAIGESIEGALARTIFGTIAIGFGFGIAGVLLLIVTAVRRSRAPAPA